MAENTGLIVPLTLEVLDMALAQTARAGATRARRSSVAVNLSVRAPHRPASCPTRSRRCCTRTACPPQPLTLEVTESTIMTDPARALAVLDRLRALGVALAIDDFGTGYSSLAYLRRLHVDELKIDRSFVMELDRARATTR